MPRPKLLTPKAHLHITIDAMLREQLDSAVWFDLEGKIPAGALQKFVECRLREYFSQAELNLGEYILGAGTVFGGEHTIKLLKEHLEGESKHG